eukprot:gene2903-3488_t
MAAAAEQRWVPVAKTVAAKSWRNPVGTPALTHGLHDVIKEWAAPAARRRVAPVNPPPPSNSPPPAYELSRPPTPGVLHEIGRFKDLKWVPQPTDIRLEALPSFTPPSRDAALLDVARANGATLASSTSAVTSVFFHLYQLLSCHRPPRRNRGWAVWMTSPTAITLNSHPLEPLQT